MTARAAAAGIVALALALRLWAIPHGLPDRHYPDEYRYVTGAQRMLGGDFNPHYFHNPSAWTYALAAVYAIWYALARLAGEGAGVARFALAPDPTAYYLVARALAAACGAATVAAVYLLARRTSGVRAGVIAALLLAVSLLHVRESHIALNDVAATLWIAIAALGAVHVADRGALRHYVAAGLAAGLAVATKYNAGIVVATLVAAHLLGPRPRAWRGLLAGGAAAACGFLAGCPYAVLDAPAFLAEFREQAGFAASGWLGQDESPVPVLYLDVLGRGFGRIALALVIVASALGLARAGERRATLLLLAFPAAYLGAMLPVDLFFARFALPLLPFLAVLAGRGADDLLGRTRGRAGRALAALVAAAAVLEPLVSTLRHDQLLAREDTRQVLARWIEDHLPAGSAIAAEGFTPSLADYSWEAAGPLGADPWGKDFHAVEARLRALPRRHGLRFHTLYADPDYRNRRKIDELAAQGVDHVIVSSFTYGRFPADPPPAFYQELAERARLRVRITPMADGSPDRFRLDSLNSPLHDLWQRSRPGPELKVYAIR